MIFDKVDRLPLYAGLGENFRTAADFLARTDWRALPVGRTEVDGENVYINVMDRVLEGESELWESHNEYADIQIIAAGGETVVCGFPTDAAPSTAYNPENDATLYHGLTGLRVTLREGDFVLLLPGEPHRPNCRAEGDGRAKKLVFKVKIPRA